MKLSVKEWLQENLEYHMETSYTGHSFPCGVWAQPKGSVPWPRHAERKKWIVLAKHGLLPKTFVLIAMENSYGKERQAEDT